MADGIGLVLFDILEGKIGPLWISHPLANQTLITAVTRAPCSGF